MPERDPAYDTLVMGAGMAGLASAALLANRGERVLLLEAHDAPGGYAHSFQKGPYRFCAQVHYIFNCGEGEPIHNLLTKLGLADAVRFRRLDPEGYDHLAFPGLRYRVPNGLAKHRERLIHYFPREAEAIRAYFDEIRGLTDELARLPETISWSDVLTAPLRFPRLLWYRNFTLQDLYDKVGLPLPLQGLLAGQAGDYQLPPGRISLLLHAGLVMGYDKGAYYPEKHFAHFVGQLAEAVARQPGCRVLYGHEVTAIHVAEGRVASVETRDGSRFTARRYVSNMDPASTLRLAGPEHFPAEYRARTEYEYSASSFIVYLGLAGIDLREHGFGSFNVWHYPSFDLNAIYERQLRYDDLDDPWLFMGTPTLHTDAPGAAPPGHQILELVTTARYGYFKDLLAQGKGPYQRAKTRVMNRILDVVEAHYVPNLRKAVKLKLAGTPTTNERFCWSPFGNSYGAALTPRNVSLSRLPHETPLPNLFLANATAGYPSVAGTVNAALGLYKELTGETV